MRCTYLWSGTWWKAYKLCQASTLCYTSTDIKKQEEFLVPESKIDDQTDCLVNANKPKVIWIKLEQKQAEK